MTPATSSRIMILLSIVFGGTVAIVAAAGSDSVGLVATIGAVILGVLWSAQALFSHGRE